MMCQDLDLSAINTPPDFEPGPLPEPYVEYEIEGEPSVIFWAGRTEYEACMFDAEREAVVVYYIADGSIAISSDIDGVSDWLIEQGATAEYADQVITKLRENPAAD